MRAAALVVAACGGVEQRFSGLQCHRAGSALMSRRLPVRLRRPTGSAPPAPLPPRHNAPGLRRIERLLSQLNQARPRPHLVYGEWLRRQGRRARSPSGSLREQSVAFGCDCTIRTRGGSAVTLSGSRTRWRPVISGFRPRVRTG
jgi:hypothetical protein